MNIFYTDSDPVKAAQNLCDKHVVKMIVESCQMLSTAYRLFSPQKHLIPPTIYKPTHVSHPCTLWVSESLAHYGWLLAHAWAIEEEYQHRYHKYHACRRALHELSRTAHFSENISMEWVDPPQCMPEQYKVPDHPITAYRQYYRAEKSSFAHWTRRSAPAWFYSFV